jgi:polysaccharide export outer membrane protein
VLRTLTNIVLSLVLAVVAPLAAVQAEQAASPQMQAAQPERPYTVNAGDEIEIYVWGEERLQRVVRVLPDGTFSFPLVGKVMAQGLVPSQIEALIAKGLEPQYRGQAPQVTVSVRSPSGMQISVMGKVRAPGTFTPGRYINLLEAVSIAGGPSEFADLDNVTIVRKTATGLVSIRARLGGALKSGSSARDLSANNIPQLESGDTVIVP